MWTRFCLWLSVSGCGSASQDGGNTASYVYDAEGRRVQKTTTAQVEYLYDLNGNIVTELSSTGAWNRGEIGSEQEFVRRAD